MRALPSSLFVCGFFTAVACGASETSSPNADPVGGAGGTTAGASGGGNTMGSGGGSEMAGTSNTTGAGGRGGSAGAPNDGDASTVTTKDAATKDAATKDDAHSGGASGPLTSAGCAGKDYALCIDFEDGIDTTWTGGTANAIVTTDFAHGGHSYLLYPKGGGMLKSMKMGAIKNQLWGRFYVHFKPGAPGQHGEIVGAYDQANNWYEMGWEFNGILADWHGLGGEKPLRSMPFIMDQWYCVEYFFDGAKGVMPQWWIDGTEATYRLAVPAAKGPVAATQFTRVEIGFQPFHPLDLTRPDGDGPPDPRVLTDMWIDDIVFDSKRIGCIDGPVGP